MRFIDNVSDLLGDDLKAEVTSGSKVRIAASTFSIFAFEALRKELEQVEKEIGRASCRERVSVVV